MEASTYANLLSTSLIAPEALERSDSMERSWEYRTSFSLSICAIWLLQTIRLFVGEIKLAEKFAGLAEQLLNLNLKYKMQRR
jgi:hypothetical protein